MSYAFFPFNPTRKVVYWYQREEAFPCSKMICWKAGCFPLLIQPMRIDEIRRALPEAGKRELKDALRPPDRGRSGIMKNKKNRFAVSPRTTAA